MSECDIVLTCSNEDNWPNILVEAGSYGCVPVVGPGHGCEEFVRAYGFGEVAKDYSVEAFGAALLAALSSTNDETRQPAVKTIRQDHSPEIVASRFGAIANFALAQRHGRSRDVLL
jgi:glycosyltransferase involved in cell wall biosynthesis